MALVHGLASKAKQRHGVQELNDLRWPIYLSLGANMRAFQTCAHGIHGHERNAMALLARTKMVVHGSVVRDG